MIPQILLFLKNPKSWTLILFILILLLVGLFFYQRNRTQIFKNKYEDQVKETARVTNNYLASQDTIKTYKNKNGDMTSQIGAYEVTAKEWQDKYSKLFSLYLKEQNKDPKIVVQYKYILKDTITSPTLVSDTAITYGGDTIKYKGDNWTLIRGRIPYSLNCYVKKNSVTQYAYDQAKVYAYDLQQRGLKEAVVVAFKNNKAIAISDAVKDTNVIFKIQIKQSNTDIIDDLSKVVDKSYIDVDYSNKVYTYTAGVFIPNTKVDLTKSSFLQKLTTGSNELVFESAAEILTGLYKDKTTGRLMIDVTTSNPNIKFTKIVGAEILNAQNTKKMERSMRKQFGIGLNIGVGAMLTPSNSTWVMKYGPEISIGLNWTPRWAQFGASKSLDNSLLGGE